MPTQPAVSLTPQLLVKFLWRHAALWVAPAVIGFVLAAVYSLVTERKWEASQGFLIRSEAAGFAEQRLGKFTDLSEMKAVQETVLEIARSKSVLTAALQQVGPPASLFGRLSYPTAEEVVDLRDNMSIAPPGGAEFGLTEVFYLTVQDADSERAAQLAAALADQLENRMAEVRDSRAASLVSELQNSLDVARRTRDFESERLAKFEATVGADLAELRALESTRGGQGELAQTVIAIEAALRQNSAERRQSEQLLALLKASVDSPDRLLATPSTLLASQPGLDRLKTGIVDAQINTARLAGTRSSSHPLVTAARNRESLMRAELFKELPAAIAGVEVELILSKQRAVALRDELASTRDRITKLAGKRSKYSTLVASVLNHNQLVEVAENQLAEARADQAGAQSSSVLSRLDQVEAGLHPLGPGRVTTALAGGLAGLVFGLSLVFGFHSPTDLIEAPPQPSYAETMIGPFGAPISLAYDMTPQDVWTQPAIGAGHVGHTGYAGRNGFGQ